MRHQASYSAVESPTRATLHGFALFAVLLAVLAGFGPGSGQASAATLSPCETTNPTGPTIDLEGQLELTPVKATRKTWKRSGIRQKLIRPTSNLTGRPSYPVSKVAYGATARVDLKGGSKLIRKRRSVAIRKLVVRSAAGKPARVRASIGGKKVNFLVIRGGKRVFDPESGELSRVGKARLTARAAKLLNKRLRLSKRKKLRAGAVWGHFNLYSLYKVTQAEDPTVEAPPVPPVKVEPSGAQAVTGAATIKWYVRDKFIDYIAQGRGTTRVEHGATADLPSGPNHLVYSFNFPFASGWTVSDGPAETLVKGSGLVGFRFCKHGINFTVSNPEIEIGDNTNSRLIFEVTGTNNTLLASQRAVVANLLPEDAASRTSTDNGDGTTTVSYEKIPSLVPAEGAGLFADFYFPNDPFGYFSLTYTYSDGGG